MRCHFCQTNLAAVEMGRGNVCTACSHVRNGTAVRSKSDSFLAAWPSLRRFARDVKGHRVDRRGGGAWSPEEAMAFNARRMREKAYTEAHVCRAVRF